MNNRMFLLMFRRYDAPIVLILNEKQLLDKLNRQDLAELTFIDSPAGGETAKMVGPGTTRIDLENFPEGTAILTEFRPVVPQADKTVITWKV